MQLNGTEKLRRWGVAPPCEDKARYATEALAREVGRARAKEAGIDLWVYHCPFCVGYHLTKTERSPHWHVCNEFDPRSDYEAATGDPFFWDRLMDMDHNEADTLLRRVRAEAIAAKATAYGAMEERLGLFLSRIGEEIRVLSVRGNRFDWIHAVRNLFGEEAVNQVKVEMARMRHEQEQTL